MGQHIVREASSDENGNQSKIWDEKEAKRVLLHNKIPIIFNQIGIVCLFLKTITISTIYEYAYNMNSPN
jgi:hypothetical protein